MKTSNGKKRGRPPAPNPKIKISVYMTPEQQAAIDAYRAVYGLDLSSAMLALALQALHSNDVPHIVYHDSGRAAIDEAAEQAERLAALTNGLAQ